MRTGKVALQPVVNTTQKTAQRLIKIYAQGKLLSQPTPNHRFYLGTSEASAGRWVAAENLQPGDSLWLFNQRRIAIDSLIKVDTTVRVYNFEVANFHTYYVGKQSVLVHNDCGALPKFFVQVQPSGSSAASQVLQQAKSIANRLTSTQKPMKKFKVQQSLVGLISSAGNSSKSLSIASLNFLGKINKGVKKTIESKWAQTTDEIYLGINLNYNENKEELGKDISPYNKKYLLAIYRDMTFAHHMARIDRNSKAEGLHCLMFPIIPDPAAGGTVTKEVKELLQPLLKKLRRGNKNVFEHQINYLPIAIPEKRLKNPLTYQQYNFFLEKALESITNKYKSRKSKKIKAKSEDIRNEFLHLIKQARRYFGNKAAANFSNKGNYRKRIGPSETIISQWKATYEPLAKGLEGVTYHLLELGIDVFFKHKAKPRFKGNVFTVATKAKTISEAGIARALQNEEFRKMAVELYKGVQQNEGKKFNFPVENANSRKLLKQLLRTYLVNGLFEEDRRTRNNFTEKFRNLTMQKRGVNLSGEAVTGHNGLFIDGLRHLNITDIEEIEGLCRALFIEAIATQDILYRMQFLDKVDNKFKNQRQSSWQGNKDFLNQVIYQQNGKHIVHSDWKVYGIKGNNKSGVTSKRLLKTTPGTDYITPNDVATFITDNDPQTALYCKYVGKQDDPANKIVEELVFANMIDLTKLSKMESEHLFQTTGVKPSVLFQFGGAWWNTQVTFYNRGGTWGTFKYLVTGGVTFATLPLAAAHYSARYKPGEPLPAWANLLKTGAEWALEEYFGIKVK
nr:polymorphic toxin-type HINT domain-containing protein [uncultured Microscilla sp.]